MANTKIFLMRLATIIMVSTFGIIGFSCNVFAGDPMDVKKTNIRDNQFSISWITAAEEAGSINYGTTPALGNIRQDDRGPGVPTDTHHVTVSSLEPDRLYYYDIVSGGSVYNNGGAHYTVTTGSNLGLPAGSDLAYGRVFMPDGSLAVGAIVYLNLSDNDFMGTSGVSQDASAFTDSNGWWSYNLAYLRRPDLLAYFTYSTSGDNEILTAKKGMNDSASQTIDTGSDTPAPAMTLGWTLNMIDMQWRQKESYSGAASCEMILDYIRQGIAPDLSQTDIYNHAHPYSDLKEMTPDEMDLALGHFDPYDNIVSNWSDYYDSTPDGNPYQGYNYTVDAYSASEPDAMNEYMRDIVHWMAYTVTKEDWWRNGELVQRPNTPAAVPIFGNTVGYDHWIVIKGAVTNINPLPEPHVNPWNTPDFTVYGFWVKDPDISGIGQDSYKTAAECESHYFKPLNTADIYNGLYIQVAEPPAAPSDAYIDIPKPSIDEGNLEFIGIEPRVEAMSVASSVALGSGESSSEDSFSPKSLKKTNWKDLVDPHMLSDMEAVAAFEGARIGKPVFVHRIGSENADYYLVPFNKVVKGRGLLTSAVIILDSEKGYFKEAAWTNEPQDYLEIGEGEAKSLVSRNGRHHSKLDCQLVWEPGEISGSPYHPYWQVSSKNNVWYVTQDGRVIQGS